MTRRTLLRLTWFVFTLAWALPVHQDGTRLPKGLPGWEAFRVAAAAVWPYEGVEYETWWGGALSSLSAATNLVMLVSIVVRSYGRQVHRGIGAAAAAAFLVNAQWLFLTTEWTELRAGYYLWWLSFLALGCLGMATLQDAAPETVAVRAA